MRRIAVDLDDETGLAPVEVDGEPADPNVHLRLWNPVVAADAEEGCLELAACVVCHRGVAKQAEILGLADGPTPY